MTAAAASPAASGPGRSLVPRIAAAGLAGGGVDFAYASLLALSAGKSLAGPWRGVASGWIGPAAKDGVGPVVLGLVTHFAIAACMGAVYVLVARRIPVVVRRPLATGAIYGLFLYAAMYLVVLPLRWPQVFPKWDGGKSALDVAAHILVGLAIAWVASRDDRAINPKPAAATGV